MSTLTIEATRSGLVESFHTVSVAVVDTEGTLVAQAGDPHRVTYWRSAAKPFQTMPMVRDGAAEHYGFGARELALACGSHSSEPMHRALAASMLRACGCEEHQLACGPHPPLSQAVADEAMRAGVILTPRWSNCSGKHAGLLALARHHGWDTQGYERAGHPVQERVLDEVMRWTGQSRDALKLGVDGCRAVCFGLSLRAMATAYARLGVSPEPAARQLREAMVTHPELVAGTGRPCTDLMAAARGAVVAKVGAEGVYCAAIPEVGLGLALKVEDGDGRCSPPALLAVLRQVGEQRGLSLPVAELRQHAEPVLRTTRGEPIGELRATGALRFH
ncbi:asparaginase [Pyxidicoccus fallax]|uniref:Asparaginase n=1 Tax=Pyxidicoccus fallax TaxID=394095 RepID=A0A848LY06_9BACT|nr:asparaginase [Pyxidicoccus fallax]NMO23068.1 asparaginase [Pyxidicoccus fallax]NPC85675.1 asparaginase [Pyxidicoccus fallax]